MSRYWETGYYSQPTEKEIKSRANATKKKESAKGKMLAPVTVTGRNIVKSWWGKAWCNNLERYADYDSRLDRGKRYVRSNAIVDLQIEKGRIFARVQGTRKIPYKVEIRISPLSEERCQNIIERCSTKLENVERLIQGDFPEDMKLLFEGTGGLFPEPKEISFQCSCPDWALMCKHVAAALYGVGVRLDEQPLLFFELRGIDFNRFIDVTLANKVESMLKYAEQPKSTRVIEDSEIDLTKLFGVL